MADNSNENFFEGYAQDGQDTGNSGAGVESGENDQLQAESGEAMLEDSELADLKQRVKGLDEEAARLIQLQSEMEQQMKTTSSPTTNFGSQVAPMTAEEKMEADQRSIYVGNVDYSATAQELEAHFHGCGSINRVTILCDKFSGHPKGYAYVEFGDKDAVQTAMALDESLFKGRQIKVVSKRTNRPGISSTDRFPRGGGRGMGFRGGRGGRGGGYGGPSPYMRSMRGRVVKGGRGGFYNSYAPY